MSIVPVPRVNWSPLVVTAFIALALVVASCGGSSRSRLSDHLIVTRPEGLVEHDLASGDEHLLVPQPDNATLVEPAVSPDGSRIAYVGLLSAIVIPGQSTDLGSNIYVANADGSGAHIAVEHAVRGEQLHTPAWLPDGNLLVYSQRFENRQIVVSIEHVDLTTAERSVIVENGLAPAPSPDGTQLAFLRPQPDLTLSLWAANGDGSDERQIAAGTGLISFNRPRYSPDGRAIIVGATGPGELLRSPRSHEEYVSVDASGMAARHTNTLNGLPEDIWLIDMQTGEARRLADLDLDQPTAVFSGDGLRIFAFGDRGLYQIFIDGGEKRLADGMFHGQIDWLSAGADH